jgi:1-acyl-sn-glycerol-3-phosphate acyltransferase
VAARSLLFNILSYLNFLVQAVIFSPVLLLPERCFWPVGRFWVRSTLWLHRTIVGGREDVRGRENIPAGGFIVAAKHQSAWETLKLVELFPRPTFILKRQLLFVPLFGWYLKKAHMIPVARGKGAEAIDSMMDHARRAIVEKRQIIIFPEGTRRPPLAEPNYRYGVVRLYRDLGVPCLPVALNSGLFWPRRRFVHRRGTIVLECLPPIAPGLGPDEFAKLLQERIEAASRSLADEAVENVSGSSGGWREKVSPTGDEGGLAAGVSKD